MGHELVLCLNVTKEWEEVAYPCATFLLTLYCIKEQTRNKYATHTH